MLNLAIKSWGSGTFAIEKQLEAQPHEAGLLKLDISKAIDELDWKPKLDATKAVDITMSWYLEFANNPSNIDLFTENQILNYLNA